MQLICFPIFACLVVIGNCEKLAIFQIDGFRWDYVDRLPEAEVPNFSRLIKEGVRAEYVQPLFPSMSFPSWTTIVTGLRADQHGIVGNNMYDRESKRIFSLYDENGQGNHSDWWDQHFPLWASATEEGRRVSLYGWSRCDIPFKGNILPEKCAPFQPWPSINLQALDKNVDDAVKDLKDGFDLTMIFNARVDTFGHLVGPDAEVVDCEVRKADKWIGRFLDQLEAAGIRDETNVAIVSDHGMTNGWGKKTAKLSYFVDMGLVDKAVGYGAMMHVSLKYNCTVDEFVSQVKRMPGVDVYKKEDIPDRLGFRDNDLIHDVLIVSRGDVLIESDEKYANQFVPRPKADAMANLGRHGFDDTSPNLDTYEEGKYPDMRGIFFAAGPSFKRGYTNKWIKLVDEYQIFVHVLGIKGEEHEGNFDRVKGMFKDQSKENEKGEGKE